MEYSNELLDSFVGDVVLVKQLTAPGLSAEFAERVNEDPLNAQTQLLHSQTALMVLVGYDGLGVILELIEEDPVQMFVPWSAIIEISAVEEEGSEEEYDQQTNEYEEERADEQTPGRMISPAEKGREHEGGV